MKLNSIILLTTSFLFLNCSKTMKDIYLEENIPLKVSGKIKSIEFYKGGNTQIFFGNKIFGNTIALGKHSRDKIMVGDYFEKMKNSNKCLIVRNDSLLILDCFDSERLTHFIGDSLYKTLEKWDRKMANKWYLVNDTINVKKLME